MMYICSDKKLVYLISTPIPHGNKRRTDQDSWPRKVRGQRVSQNMKGVVTRQSTGTVGIRYVMYIRGIGIRVLFWNSFKIFDHQAIYASNLDKPYK